MFLLIAKFCVNRHENEQDLAAHIDDKTIGVVAIMGTRIAIYKVSFYFRSANPRAIRGTRSNGGDHWNMAKAYQARDLVGSYVFG